MYSRRDKRVLSRDFRFGFLAAIDCTFNRLRWSRFFILSISSDCRGPERFGAASSGYRKTRKYLISSDFSHTSPSPFFLRPVCLPAAVPYPVCKGSAAIRRTMLPNSCRVRWLSASNNQ